MIPPRDALRPGFGAVAGLVLVSALGFGCESQATEPLPDLGEIPSFSMVDHTGQAFRDSKLRGRVSVVSFIFTQCPTICPLISERTRILEEELGGGERVQLVSFSVDPEHDTPEVLRAYRAGLGAGARWVHVTGDSPELARAVARGFRTAVGDRTPVQEGEGYDILHSSHFILVDERGHLRGFYRSSDPAEVARLRADVDRLLQFQ